eukprot:6585071-Pyramimonas_sp.AAC.1
MGSEDRAASPMHRRCGSMWPSSLRADVAGASPTSPMHRGCVADASAMHRRSSPILRPHPCTRESAQDRSRALRLRFWLRSQEFLDGIS